MNSSDFMHYFVAKNFQSFVFKPVSVWFYWAYVCSCFFNVTLPSFPNCATCRPLAFVGSFSKDLTTSQLNSFDSFEACCVANNLALPPAGVIDSLHKLKLEQLLYLHQQLPRIQEPFAHCSYGTMDRLTHGLRSWFQRS
jgi:hypothetical protein